MTPALSLLRTCLAAAEPATGGHDLFLRVLHANATKAPKQQLVFRNGDTLVLVTPNLMTSPLYAGDPPGFRYLSSPHLCFWYMSYRSGNLYYRRHLSFNAIKKDKNGDVDVSFVGAIVSPHVTIKTGPYKSMISQLLDAVPAAFGAQDRRAGSWELVPNTPETVQHASWLTSQGHF